MIEQTKAEKLLVLEIKTLIEAGRNKAVAAVYSALTLTYWQVGKRMMQFSEIFPDFEILSPLVSQLSWTHFTLLLPLQNHEARMFYVKQTIASN
jgi:hypothetical protein